MLLPYFIVFAAVAIISSVDVALGSPNVTIFSTLSAAPVAAPRLASGDQSADTSAQFMTANDTTDRHSEDRVGSSLAVVEKAKSLLVDDVFKKLGAKGKLFDSPQFVSWLRYADDFAKKNPDQPNIGIRTLVRHFNDEEQ